MIDALLDALWPRDWRPTPCYVELREMGNGDVWQYYEDVERAEYLQDQIDRAVEMRMDVYFGVLPRVRYSGTNADVPDTTPILWADVDAKKASDDLVEGKRLALEAINGFSTPPHIVVDSGGGYHCYWLLAEAVPLERAQVVMRWIARELRGDFVQDGARILRVPSTINWKRSPTTARYLRFDTLRPRIRLSDLEGQMPVEKMARPVQIMGERVDELPDWLMELIVLGVPEGQRSEACFKVAYWLLRYGRSPDEIRQTFLEFPQGIGAKAAGMSRWQADRWIDRTINNAGLVTAV